MNPSCRNIEISTHLSHQAHEPLPACLLTQSTILSTHARCASEPRAHHKLLYIPLEVHVGQIRHHVRYHLEAGVLAHLEALADGAHRVAAVRVSRHILVNRLETGGAGHPLRTSSWGAIGGRGVMEAQRSHREDTGVESSHRSHRKIT